MSGPRSSSGPGGGSSDPHVIRLHGPWQYEARATPSGTNTGAANGVLKLPADLSTAFGSPSPTHVTLHRRFGRPSNLDPLEQVDLVIERLDLCGDITVNGVALGGLSATESDTRYKITTLLQPRNELTLAISLATEPSSPSPQPLHVRLEISGKHGSAEANAMMCRG